MTPHDLLTHLLELTPPPPPGGSELPAEQLIAAFEVILEQRAGVIAQLTGPVALDDDDRAIWREIERRQTAWQDTLGATLRAVAAQRSGTKKLRDYAQHL